MEPQVIGLLGIVALLVAISLGLHIGVALGTVGFLGLVWITGSWNMGISLLTTAPWSTTAVYPFSALPLFVLMGINQIWFAMLVAIIEIGLLTPPVGINIYTVKVSAPAGTVTLEEVFQGITPFFVASLLALAILMFFPSISLFIPATMLGN